PDDEGLVLVDTVAGQTFTHGGADTPADVFRSGLPWAPAVARGDQTIARFDLGLAHRRLSIVDLKPTGHQPMCDAGGRCWIGYNGEIYNHVELRAELEAAEHRFTGGGDTRGDLAAGPRGGRGRAPRPDGPVRA